MHNSVISGHLGQKKTLEKLLQRFYWFNVREDVQMCLLKCDICAAKKPPVRTPKTSFSKMLVGAPLDHISVDFLGPLPVTPRNNWYILLATDHFTQWVEVMAVPNQVVTLATLTSFLEKQRAEEAVQNSQKAYREYNN